MWRNSSSGCERLTICAHAQVDLVAVAVFLEGLSDTQDGIRRAFFDISPCGCIDDADCIGSSSLPDCRTGSWSEGGEHDGGSGRSNNVQEGRRKSSPRRMG